MSGDQLPAGRTESVERPLRLADGRIGEALKTVLRRDSQAWMESVRRLVECAALAPSTHNTQPWLFIVGPVGHDEIRVWADRSRWLPVTDPDRRELYLSVGCAIENILVAAEHLGLAASVQYFPDPVQDDFIARVRLDEGGALSNARADLLDAIRTRRTVYEPYDGRPIASSAMTRLREVVFEPEIQLIFRTSVEVRTAVERLIARADAIQFADPEFRAELAECIGRGAYGAPWLLAKLGQMAIALFDLGESAARRDVNVLMSSPLVAVVATSEDTLRARVRAGQVFERLHLAATACGVCLQPMNQVIQVPSLRDELLSVVAPELAADLHPQMLVRLGYSSAPAASPPRRPLEEFLAADR
jgi:nitroreductase